MKTYHKYMDMDLYILFCHLNCHKLMNISSKNENCYKIDSFVLCQNMTKK